MKRSYRHVIGTAIGQQVVLQSRPLVEKVGGIEMLLPLSVDAFDLTVVSGGVGLYQLVKLSACKLLACRGFPVWLEETSLASELLVTGSPGTGSSLTFSGGTIHTKLRIMMVHT